MKLDLSSKITLNNGVKIPILGLGTWQIRGNIVEKTILWALEAGYRHIDTAWVYSNEKRIGNAIKKSGIDREDIFITTKLWNSDHGHDKPLKAIDKSLKNLDLDYLDLYLIHWPVPGNIETWKVMEKILKDGKARAIGVSNFLIHYLEQLLPEAEVIPTVNQVEFTPYLYLKDLHAYCEKNNIKIEAYSPLTRGKKFQDPKLVEIADSYNKTAAQILIRWNLQHGSIVIPKSTHKKWIVENSQVFDFNISEEDMEKLSGLNENLRVSGSTPHKKLNERFLQ
ncbi:MAG: aldo/keto reductase [Candidatus Hodarchaeota archaeon]